LQALLILAVVYVLFKALAKAMSLRPIQVYPDRFPPDAVLIVCIVVLTALTFVEHLIWPVGKAIFLNFQAGFLCITSLRSLWASWHIEGTGSGACRKRRPAAGGSCLWW
jgi:hypothetical protein